MNTASIELFVSLSSFLTGISASKLAPQVDPNEPPLKKVYYDQANKAAGPTLQKLLDTYKQNMGQPPDVIANAIFKNADPMVSALARSIMLEWYLGSWYSPENLLKYAPKNPVPPPPEAPYLPGPVPSVVISDTAYTSGWSWSMAQAHPMGYSNYSFGYWAAPPPPLSAYLGTGS